MPASVLNVPVCAVGNSVALSSLEDWTSALYFDTCKRPQPLCAATGHGRVASIAAPTPLAMTPPGPLQESTQAAYDHLLRAGENGAAHSVGRWLRHPPLRCASLCCPRLSIPAAIRDVLPTTPFLCVILPAWMFYAGWGRPPATCRGTDACFARRRL